MIKRLVGYVFPPLYWLLGILAWPFLVLFLRQRCRGGKEIPSRLVERWGYPTQPRPHGPVVWIHGASVGESLSALPLIDRIKKTYPTLTILMTSGTVSSAQLLAQRLPQGVIHQFLPCDTAPCVNRFLDYWHPSLVIWLESELWPMYLMCLRRRHISAVLINARISDRAYAWWKRFLPLAQDLLGVFSLCFASSQDAAEKFQDLGLKNTHMVGNLKYAGTPLPAPVDAVAAAGLLLNVDQRSIWVAASTHPGEEKIMALAYTYLKNLQDQGQDCQDSGVTPKDLLVLVPRHHNRGQSIADELTAMGLTVALRSLNQVPTLATDIYMADTLGELGTFFSLSHVVVMGGSFVPIGGHNPLEPASFSAALVWGPYMFNFSEVEASFLHSHAAFKVVAPPHTPDAEMDEVLARGLAEVLQRLVRDPSLVASMAQGAHHVLELHAKVLDDTMAALAPYLHDAAET